MKKIVLFALGMAMSMTTFAQEESEVETTIGADVVSSYIWRGQDLGSAALQPTLGIAYKGLSLSAWGSYGLVDVADTKEFDLTLAYTIGGLNIGVTDYWFNTMPTGGDPDGRYFKYDAHATNHVLEANIGYDFGFASLNWFTNFAGNDYKKDGKRAYSSYMEVVVPFKLSAIEWTATAGAVPSTSLQYGTNGFAVTNVALKAMKDIKISDTFSVPVFAEVAANPRAQKAYLTFGVTLHP